MTLAFKSNDFNEMSIFSGAAKVTVSIEESFLYFIVNGNLLLFQPNF